MAHCEKRIHDVSIPLLNSSTRKNDTQLSDLALDTPDKHFEKLNAAFIYYIELSHATFKSSGCKIHFQTTFTIFRINKICWDAPNIIKDSRRIKFSICVITFLLKNLWNNNQFIATSSLAGSLNNNHQYIDMFCILSLQFISGACVLVLMI